MKQAARAYLTVGITNYKEIPFAKEHKPFTADSATSVPPAAYTWLLSVRKLHPFRPVTGLLLSVSQN